MKLHSTVGKHRSTVVTEANRQKIKIKIMRQPALGKKIAELRKAKGLTQEELVEMCNISVRTIQRIETGEVTPRSYTIKTILGALGADLERVSTQEASARFSLSSLFQMGKEGNENAILASGHLNLAWLAGIVYFVLGIPESIAEYYRLEQGEMIMSQWLYISIKLMVVLSYIFFQRGFIVLATLYNNYLLKLISILLIGMSVLMVMYDIVSVFYDPLGRELVMAGWAITFGGTGLVYGLALFRLQKPLGNIASVAGAFEALAAICFLTVFLSPFGLILLFPAELAEIILLFKAAEMLKEKTYQASLAVND